MQSFTWPVLTKEELLEQQRYLKPGEYDFQIIGAQYRNSKSGKPMFELTLKIWDVTGDIYTAKEWLLLTKDFAHKIRGFWICVGHPEIYEKGQCKEDDFLDKQGRCKTDAEPSQDGETMFIRVKKFLKPEGDSIVVKPSTISPVVEDFVEDDIPF